MISLHVIKVALAAATGIFAVAAIGISVAVVERQNQLREVSRYNLVWAASQALSEFHRLEERVAAFGLPNGGITAEEVAMRFDIMENRIGVLDGGDLAAFVASNPEQQAIVGELRAALRDVEPLVGAIDQPSAPQRILARLTPLEVPLTRFAASTNQFGGQQVAEDQGQLLRLHWMFSAVAGGSILCGVAFIGLLLAQQRLLRAMTDDLRAAKEAAETASDAKSRFLATMSHELRTPLNAIIGFSEMITQEVLGPVGQPKYREYVGDILKSGRHMHNLVSDILTMAKLDAGRFELAPVLLDLHSLTQSVVIMLKGAEMARDRDVAIEPDGDWPWVRADERAVKQMLLNLLSNAVKFSAPETPVRIHCRRSSAAELWLTVADRGIGMTANEAAAALEPFHQIDNRLARKYEGTGLGLSIVKGLIELHGGRLVLESEPAQGTRVSLIFPGDLIEPEPQAKAA